MKILLINHFPLQGSGSGIYTLNIALELIKKNHKVHILVVDNEISKNEYSFGVSTLLFDQQRNAIFDLPFNFPCFTTHPKSSNTFYDLNQLEIKQYVQKFLEKTEEICKNWKPDIIHAQHLWIAPYIAHKLNIPYIITAHGTDLMGFRKDSRYHHYVKTAASHASKIITISRQVNEDTKNMLKLADDNLFLNPNGFDDSIFRIKKVDKKSFFDELEIPFWNQQIVSFVGKFTEFKGIDILIKAAKVVSEQYSEVIFILAGDGELRISLEKLTRTLKLSNVFFIGHQSQQKVASLYNIADVSTVPSRIEPFGLVAIEALACGTPVVATNAGGLPDFINEKVGKLVTMEDPKALANGIINELKNKTKKTKGIYAASYAKENYSWEQNIRNVLHLYQEII